jgi:hypothetical protein
MTETPETQSYTPPPPTPPRKTVTLVAGGGPDDARDAVLRRILLDLAELKQGQARIVADLHDLLWRKEA